MVACNGGLYYWFVRKICQPGCDGGLLSWLMGGCNGELWGWTDGMTKWCVIMVVYGLEWGGLKC